MGLLKKLLIIVTLFCCFSAAYADAVLFNKNLQAIVDNNREKFNLPALSVSIKLPGSSNINDYVSGYYSRSDGNKITPDTLFQIGSITKTFTATIILKLIEDNKLTIKDNLGKWLPQYPRWKDITIYELLRHTSGVYNYTSGNSFDNLLRKNPQQYWSLQDLSNMAYSKSDLFRPGQKYSYTNTDYVLLGMIIEKATGKTIQEVFDDYLKQRHLLDTFYSPGKYSRILETRLAHGYNQDGTFPLNIDVTFVSLSFGQSAGAMISTPHDLIKWLHDLFTGKIISKQSLTDMTTIISENNTKVINNNEISIPNKINDSKVFSEIGIGIGMGLVYLKNNGFTWVHAGGTPGYESFYAYSPCNGIYLALAYNVKPKTQFIFIQIANEIFKYLNNSPEVIKTIKNFQKSHSLPPYCKHN